jgi:phage shock protein C
MPEPHKRLYRSRHDRMIAGICGGLGDYFNLDPMIFRAIFLLLLFGGGAGLMIYLVMWVIVPEEGGVGATAVPPDERETDRHHRRHGHDRRNLAGIIIIIFGLLLLANQFFAWQWLQGRFLFPVLIVLVGIVVVTHRPFRR